jgi:DNA ligase-associated metallophosphoesterase
MPALRFAPFTFAGQQWLIGESRAVYWPAQQALLVADLHLEKASWFAERGQMLPPYDSRETLERLAASAQATGARRILCLGDNFHDSAGPARMEPQAAGLLAALATRADLVWITGNHDAALQGIPGTVVDELEIAGIALRHQALGHEALQPMQTPEISGHYHPKLRLKIKGRAISRPCALRSETRLILPAFGTLTGGLDATAPALISAMQPARRIEAILHSGGKALTFPLPHTPV